MIQLAIKGHPTRGNEVIEILKMLGGKNEQKYCGHNPNIAYYISHKNTIVCDWGINSFTLEEFLERFPYKVGDKVPHSRGIGIITSMHWDDINSEVQYNVCINNETWLASVNFLKHYKEKETMETITIDDFKANTKEWLIDKLHGMIISKAIKTIGDIHEELHKPQYPKTYDECCKVLFPNSIELGKVLTSGYNCELLKKLGELLICRDAYWKIAGEQMGLGKPWKPKHEYDEEIFFIYCDRVNGINKGQGFPTDNFCLSFPTAEMRDAFYENFKDKIKECKELL